MGVAVAISGSSFCLTQSEKPRQSCQEHRPLQAQNFHSTHFNFLNQGVFSVRYLQRYRRQESKSFCFKHNSTVVVEETLEDLHIVEQSVDSRTYARLLQECISRKSLVEGKVIHAHILKTRNEIDSYLGSNLVNLYVKCHSLEDARQVFDKMRERNVVSWTAMIAAYVQNGYCEEALELMDLMQQAGTMPDQFTFPCLLKACGVMEDLVVGQMVHGIVIKTGFESDVCVGCALVDMYAKCGSVADARQVFEAMPERNTISWTSMIAGYGEIGNGEEALKIFRQMQMGTTKPNRVTLISVLKASTGFGIVEQGKQLHTHIIKTGFDSDLSIQSAVVVMYAKSGCFEDVSKIFSKMPKVDLLAWNSMITAFVQNGYNHEALYSFSQMQFESMKPNQFTFASILRACASIRALKQSKEVHAYCIKNGLDSDIFVGSALVDTYAKCNRLLDACTVFDKLPHKEVVSWTAMIGGYVQNERHGEAIKLFCQMQCTNVMADAFTFANVLSACASLKAPQQGKQVHVHIVKIGFKENVAVGNSLVTMYAECGNMEDAYKVFNKMTDKNVVSWTAIIAGCEKNGLGNEALKVFEEMLFDSIKPNQFTFVSVIKACMSLKNLRYGKQLHAYIRKSGFEIDSFVGSALVEMYAECGSIEDAWKVFDNSAKDNALLWSGMIVAYAENGYDNEALSLLCKMQPAYMKENHFTFSSILKACASLGALEQGKGLHAYVIKIGLESDVFVGSSLVDMYAKCRSIDDASKMFNQMPERNIVSWNALFAGYARNGYCQEAVKLFWKMQVGGMKPDQFSLVSILTACAALPALAQGLKVHACAIKTGYELNTAVGNAIVTMYAKCGCIKDSYKVFERMPERNVVSWNAMITGYAQHGCGKEAIQLFEEMLQIGIEPNHVTFVGVLSACSHVGLVCEGRHYFISMSQVHGMEPRVEHYACMVDLLGRAGHLDEAEDFIKEMPFESNALVWRTLLGACRVHYNLDLGKRAAECILALEPEDTATYVLLSNIYAVLGRWEDVAKVRKMMKDRKLKKEQGLSWIEVKNRVHTFVVGDRAHPQTEEIYSKLEELTGQIKEAGYFPDTSFVLHNVEEVQKEDFLFQHSEKLAISFGLLSTPAGAPFQVIKNLRMCGDCHNATKYISMVAGREIVVRDASRFHHFKDGLCSCGDYW